MTIVETITLEDGRVLTARRWPGQKGDVPLVLLHGLLDSSEGWSVLCERNGHAAIAFDLPGFGYSDAPRKGSVAGYAEDIAAGLDALGADRFVLVGHSLGGAVATALAEMRPSAVAALVLLAPAGFGRLRLAELVSVPGLRNVVHATLPLGLSSGLAIKVAYSTVVTNGWKAERDVVERLRSRGGALVPGAREGTRAVVIAGRSPDAFHRRRVGYDGPVLAVWGDRDRIVPASHRHGLEAALPQAQVQLWRGMGHHALAERQEPVIDLLDHAVALTRPASRRPARVVAA